MSDEDRKRFLDQITPESRLALEGPMVLPREEERMIRVTVESPYAGDVEANTKYAIECMLDSFRRGEAPFLSHLLYTRALDDLKPEMRELGLRAAMEYVGKGDLSAVYTDRGISRGMVMGIRKAHERNVRVVYRELESLRQTGRTTAMVEEAVRDLKAGKDVLILAANAKETVRITRMLRQCLGEVANDVVEHLDGVVVGTAKCWVRAVTAWERYLHMQADAVYVDHHAWRCGLMTYEAFTHFNSRKRSGR